MGHKRLTSLLLAATMFCGTGAAVIAPAVPTFARTRISYNTKSKYYNMREAKAKKQWQQYCKYYPWAKKGSAARGKTYQEKCDRFLDLLPYMMWSKEA